MKITKVACEKCGKFSKQNDMTEEYIKMAIKKKINGKMCDCKFCGHTWITPLYDLRRK